MLCDEPIGPTELFYKAILYMTPINYHNQYIKYKQQYLSLRQQNGGACVKIDDAKYNERPSPSYHANDCKGKIMDGNDGSQYLSVADKNGIYHWKKLKDMSECKTPEAYYSQVNKDEPKYDKQDVLKKLVLVTKDLLESNIYLMHVRWDTIWMFLDDAWDDTLEHLASDLKVNRKDILGKVSVLLYTENRIYWATIKGVLDIHSSIRKQDKQIVMDVFRKHFGKSLVWPKSIHKPIGIKLNKL